MKFNISCEADKLDIAADLLADAAGACGFEAFTGAPDALTGYVQTDQFDKDALDGVIEEFPIEGVTITYEVVNAPNEDWNKEWEESGFEPINIDDECIIYDAKHGCEADHAHADCLKIGIEARQAFGTGTHETTQMIVSQLLNTDLQGKQVLDCGCGTGILGIVAAKLGAEHIVAYDIDEWSVENTRHNAQLNGVEEKIEVLHGNSTVINHISGLFDIVLANINRNILLADMEMFCKVMHSGTTLIISGFYTEDTPHLIEEAEKHGLHVAGRKTRNNWACIAFSHE